MRVLEVAKKRDDFDEGAVGAASGSAGSAGKVRRENAADWLGRGLRRLYHDTVAEPIPDKFRSLLEQLDRQDAPKGGPAKGPGDNGTDGSDKSA